MPSTRERILVLTVLTSLSLSACAKAEKAAGQERVAPPAAVAAAATDGAGAGIPGPNDLVFELATEKLPAAQTELINGVPVATQTRDWPTVVITPLAVPPSPDGKPRFGKCTGTLVGPGVILFAAHCLDRKTAALRASYLKVDGISIAMTCAVHPDYLKPPGAPDPSPRRSEDYALCYADTQAELPTLKAMRFETVDVSQVKKDANVLMMGYGCTDLDTKTQDEILRIGNAKISRPAGGASEPGAVSDVAYAEILSHGPPEPALCPGDSGGPLVTGATVKQQTLPRRIRGVNSSIQPVPAGLLSRVAMLSDPRFSSWASKWIGQFPRAYICGLASTPPDPVNPPPPVARSCRL